MIKVTIFKNNDLTFGFKIKGHALSRQEMENATGDLYDLVCNSVSVLSQSTVIGLEEVLKLPIRYDINDGFLNLNLLNLDLKEVQEAQVLLLTFEKSLQSLLMSLEGSFGKNKDSEYIRLITKEVQEIC